MTTTPDAQAAAATRQVSFVLPVPLVSVSVQSAAPGSPLRRSAAGMSSG